MIREGWIKPDMDYYRFKAQLEHVPAGKLPEDRRFNPLATNPYVLYKALPQPGATAEAELIRAMDLLLDCNQRLIFSGLDESLGIAANTGADCAGRWTGRGYDRAKIT